MDDRAFRELPEQSVTRVCCRFLISRLHGDLHFVQPKSALFQNCSSKIESNSLVEEFGVRSDLNVGEFRRQSTQLFGDFVFSEVHIDDLGVKSCVPRLEQFGAQGLERPQKEFRDSWEQVDVVH